MHELSYADRPAVRPSNGPRPSPSGPARPMRPSSTVDSKTLCCFAYTFQQNCPNSASACMYSHDAAICRPKLIEAYHKLCDNPLLPDSLRSSARAASNAHILSGPAEPLSLFYQEVVEDDPDHLRRQSLLPATIGRDDNIDEAYDDEGDQNHD